MKDTCQYILKAGINKGNECGASCLNTFCHRHSVSSLQSRKKSNDAYREKNKDKLNERIRKLREDPEYRKKEKQ